MTPKGVQVNYKMTDVYLALVLTLLVVIITYLLTRRLKKSTNVVLLTGLPDAGKTAIFTKIIFNKSKKSVTSLKENEAMINELNLKLIDLPGADRLRSRFWEQYRANARHVIFMLDSTNVENKIRDLSEYLYGLLSDGILYKNKIQFTVACNKQDVDGAQKKDVIKSQLEQELLAIRSTRAGQLGKTSNEEEEDYLAKREPQEILSHVNFIETSVHNPEQLIKLIL